MSKNFLFFFLQMSNFILFLLGTFLLSSSFYLWILEGCFNSFILSIFLVSLFFLTTAAFGYFCVWNSPYSIILYEVFLFMLLIITIVLELFLYFDEDSIISYMQSTLSNTNVLGERNKLSIKEIFFYIKLLVLLSFFDIVSIFF
jgi:hypothetical protein